MRKIKKCFILAACVIFATLMSVSVVSAKTGWVKKANTYRYLENNRYVKNKIKKIGKYYYYFDKKGIRVTGWVKYKGIKYYFNPKNGHMCSSGKKKIDKAYYIFDKKQKLVTKKGYYKYKGEKYYITRGGKLANGAVRIKQRWYCYKNGRLIKKQGLYSLDNRKYYVMKNGQAARGWKTVFGIKMHFNEKNAKMDTGEIYLKGKWYILSKDGIPEQGIVQINGKKKFCVGKYGKVVTSSFISDSGKQYYAGSDGTLITGWFSLGSDRNYFDSQNVMHTGFLSLSGNLYYFNANGVLARNTYINVEKNQYYAADNGCLKRNCWFDGKYFDNQGKVRPDAATYDKNTTGQVSVELLNRLGLAQCTKLMIVAHPDDETLWGGAHLTEQGYFVVCLTNGNVSVRKREFETVIRKSGNKGIILSYPDLVNGERSRWISEKSKIAKDLDVILKYKKWDFVVTHNPDGEYGHIHHKMTNRLVTESYYRCICKNDLYYFGRYYVNITPEMEKTRISSKQEELKRGLYTIYKSQVGAITSNIQMTPYENWVRATDW